VVLFVLLVLLGGITTGLHFSHRFEALFQVYILRLDSKQVEADN